MTLRRFRTVLLKLGADALASCKSAQESIKIVTIPSNIGVDNKRAPPGVKKDVSFS
ncbi:MAG: hypothetical protein SVZ03_04915 [Spirochaetota bacterium]|nr:hypothetical protein [Spirochaetota bacterium]